MVQVDRDFGCGYPGDKDAVSWLKRHLHPVFGFPTLVRFSWQTIKTLQEEHCIKYTRKPIT
jgi:ribonuclease H2 subunit A